MQRAGRLRPACFFSIYGALRLSPGADIAVWAKGGTPGAELLPRLPADKLDGRTSVIALDLFFWDSAYQNPESSLHALHHLLEETRSRNLPLILGDIPELLPSFQPGRAKINEAIHLAVAKHCHCLLMPFDRMLQRLISQGYWEINGRRRGLREIVPDGLHLAEFAGDYLAGLLEKILQGSFSESVGSF